MTDTAHGGNPYRIYLVTWVILLIITLVGGLLVSRTYWLFVARSDVGQPRELALPGLIVRPERPVSS